MAESKTVTEEDLVDYSVQIMLRSQVASINNINQEDVKK